MDATTQTKLEELIAAAVAAGDSASEIQTAVRDSYRDALIAAEAERPIPVPQMTGADLTQLLAYLNDGRGVDDVQAIYKRLRQAIEDRNQPQFWRLLFMLLKSYRQMYPHL